MENVNVLIDGIQKDVYGIFYIYNSKYYFIYTEKEIDENNYVILYMTQVAKETQNTATGPISTGNMIGFEITDPEEQKNVQTSVSYIVEDKKNNTVNPQIQYLPINMLSNFKIVSKKRFRLLKSIMVDNFKLNFDDVNPVAAPAPIESALPDTTVVPAPIESVLPDTTVAPAPIESVLPDTVADPVSTLPSDSINNENNVIIDYRTKFFEEEDKNKELQEQIEILTKKIEEIKKIVE